MKFFAKQKVDQIGITAVSLQKILLFLMILSLFTIFNGGFFSFLLCLIGFIGAYRRSTGLLTAYVSISVVLIVLCSVVALSSIFMASNDDYVYDYTNSASSSEAFTRPDQGRMSKLQKVFARKLSAIGSESLSSSSETQTNPDGSVDSSPSNSAGYTDSFSDEEDFTGVIFLLIVAMVLGFFLAYLKIYSLVLSWRLRKMILAAATALPTTDAPQTHEFAPTNTSCAVPQENEELPPAPVAPFQPAPVFAPGFAPYPYAMPMMMPNGQLPNQYPHHIMFGQQPVFYTYAPVNPTSDEKL